MVRCICPRFENRIQEFINKLKYNIDGVNQIVRTVRNDYNRIKLMGFAETLKPCKLK